MEAASVRGTDWTYLILTTQRDYIVKIRFKMGCVNYSFSNVGGQKPLCVWSVDMTWNS